MDLCQSRGLVAVVGQLRADMMVPQQSQHAPQVVVIDLHMR